MYCCSFALGYPPLVTLLCMVVSSPNCGEFTQFSGDAFKDINLDHSSTGTCKCLICSNPKTIKNKKGIKDYHLMLIVLSLTLIDIIVLVTYTIAEGALTHFSAGVASNREKPSGVHGVS